MVACGHDANKCEWHYASLYVFIAPWPQMATEDQGSPEMPGEPWRIMESPREPYGALGIPGMARGLMMANGEKKIEKDTHDEYI